MIEILKEESLEEREKRNVVDKQQMAVKKQDKKSVDKKREREPQLPKNIRQVGDAGEHTKVYFEDYVMTYIKQQAAFGKEREDVLILYGDKRRIYGKMYYFISGAIKVEEVNSCLHQILFNQEDWKRINDIAGQFFADSSVLGWALLCEAEELELKTRVLETQEEFFGEEQPVFMEYAKAEKEENVYLYQMGVMHPQNGHYIYYDKNEKMQNYMIHEKENVEKVEEESVDHAARQFRMVVQEKQEEKKRKRTSLLLYSTAITLAIVVMLIGITLLGNYEKMENMEKVLYEMADDTTQKDTPVDTIDDKLNAIETNKSIALSELSGQQDSEIAADQEMNISQTTGQGTDQAGQVQPEQSAEPELTQPDTTQPDTAQPETAQQQNVQTETTETANVAEPATEVAAVSEPQTSQEAAVEATSTTTGETQEQAAQTENNETTVTPAEETQTASSPVTETPTEDAPAAVEYQTYEIKRGDTLEKINRLFYGTKNRIKEICELNQIENQDNICYGEKIILPY